VHFGHGLISYYLWEEKDQSGLAKTLVAALAFEMVENEEFLIRLFKEHSGIIFTMIALINYWLRHFL